MDVDPAGVGISHSEYELQRAVRYPRRDPTTTSPAVPLDQVLDRLDLPSAGIVAQMRIGKMLDETCSDPRVQALSLGLRIMAEPFDEPEQQQQQQRYPRRVYTFSERTGPDLQEWLARKHVELDDGPPRINPATNIAIRAMERCKLFGRVVGNACCYVGAFLRPKSRGLLRLICDARRANCLLDTSWLPKYSTPVIETLIQVISNIATSAAAAQRPWWLLTADVRACYHCVPLPVRLQPCFCYRLPPINEYGEHFVCYKATPMGFTSAAFSCTCITFLLVLAFSRPTTEDPDTDLPDQIMPRCGRADDFSWQHPQSWQPFASGGGAFTTVDDLVVVTPAERVAESAYRRVLSNARRWRVPLRVETDYDSYHDDIERNDPVLLQKIRCELFHRMEAGGTDDERVSALGISWGFSDYFVKVDKAEQLPSYIADFLREDNGAATWQGTRRQAASILGKCAWYRRCVKQNLLNDFDRAVLLHELQRTVAPADPSGAAWDEPFVMRTDQATALLEVWRERVRQPRIQYVNATTETSNVIFAVSDASKSEAAGVKRAALVIEPRGANVDKLVHIAIDEDTNMFPDTAAIAYQELGAILMAVRSCTRWYRQNRAQKPLQLIVLATDSDVARSWCCARDAQHEDALPALRALYAELGDVRLYLTRIDSAMNASDCYTHDRTADMQPDAKRYERTCTELRAACIEAQATWSNSGPQIGTARRPTTVQTATRRDRDI